MSWSWTCTPQYTWERVSHSLSLSSIPPSFYTRSQVVCWACGFTMSCSYPSGTAIPRKRWVLKNCVHVIIFINYIERKRYIEREGKKCGVRNRRHFDVCMPLTYLKDASSVHTEDYIIAHGMCLHRRLNLSRPLCGTSIQRIYNTLSHAQSTQQYCVAIPHTPAVISLRLTTLRNTWLCYSCWAIVLRTRLTSKLHQYE